MDAVRAGDTFVTVGPLARSGWRASARKPAPPSREWRHGRGRVARSNPLRVPIEAVEVVVGGSPRGRQRRRRALSEGHTELRVSGLHLDCPACPRELPRAPRRHRAPHQRRPVLVDGSELFSETDSIAVLDQIQGAIAYVDTSRRAPRRAGSVNYARPSKPPTTDSISACTPPACITATRSRSGSAARALSGSAHREG